MNREIKFQTVLKNPKTQKIIIRKWGFHEYGFDGPITISGWEVLGQRQYTGLKDKDGTEIYEGDIISDFHRNMHEVIFQYGCFIMKDALNYQEFLGYDLDDINDHSMKWCKVEGNIYENPELLEP